MKPSLRTACLRRGATLSKASLNIASLPSECNPEPRFFYPWKFGGGDGGEEGEDRGSAG